MYFSLDFARKKEAIRQARFEDEQTNVIKYAKSHVNGQELLLLILRIFQFSSTPSLAISQAISSYGQASAMVKLQPLSSFTHSQASPVIKLQPCHAKSVHKANASRKRKLTHVNVKPSQPSQGN